MSGRGVPQLSVGSSEASLPGPSPTAPTARVRLRPASVDISSGSDEIVNWIHVAARDDKGVRAPSSAATAGRPAARHRVPFEVVRDRRRCAGRTVTARG